MIPLGQMNRECKKQTVALIGVFHALRNLRQLVPEMWNFCREDRCFGSHVNGSLNDCSHVVLGLEWWWRSIR